MTRDEKNAFRRLAVIAIVQAMVTKSQTIDEDAVIDDIIADRMSKGAVLLADKMYFALQEREEQGEIGG